LSYVLFSFLLAFSAPVQENVEEFLSPGFSIESAIGALNELYSKYKYMETSFEKSKNIYKSKVPDIEQTLELCKLMIYKQENGEDMITNYSLSDTLYTKASVDLDEGFFFFSGCLLPSRSFFVFSSFSCRWFAGVVYLWIGAGTMVEYKLAEAVELLEQQLVSSHAKIEELQEDLYFLRGNSITVEVNMARLFNHSVKLRKQGESAATVVNEKK
jgi:hypothetical protein